MTVMQESKQSDILSQGFRYVIVGVASALFELTVFSALYYIVHISAAWASPVSLLCSTVLNFVLSKNWSFKGSSSMSRSLLLYAVLLCFNSIFTSIATQFLIDIEVPALFAKLSTMCCVVAWNFILYRKLVFR